MHVFRTKKKRRGEILLFDKIREVSTVDINIIIVINGIRSHNMHCSPESKPMCIIIIYHKRHAYRRDAATTLAASILTT